MTVETFRTISFYFMWVATISNMIMTFVGWRSNKHSREHWHKIFTDSQASVFKMYERNDELANALIALMVDIQKTVDLSIKFDETISDPGYYNAVISTRALEQAKRAMKNY